MKIGEAKRIYHEQLLNLQDRKKELEKQKKQLEQKQRTETDPAKQKQYRDEAVTLELSYQKVNGKYEENRSVMEQLLEQETAVFNQEVTKQQGESMKKFSERTLDGFLQVVKSMQKDGIKKAAIVAPGGTIMAITSQLTGDDYYSHMVNNGGGYRMYMDASGNLVSMQPLLGEDNEMQERPS